MFLSFSLSRSFTRFSPLQLFQYFLFHLELHLQKNHHPPTSTDIKNTQYHPLVALMFQNVLRQRKSTFRLILMTASLLREFTIAISLKLLWPWRGTESSLLTICFDIKGMIFHSWLWWHHLYFTVPNFPQQNHHRIHSIALLCLLHQPRVYLQPTSSIMDACSGLINILLIYIQRLPHYYCFSCKLSEVWL